MNAQMKKQLETVITSIVEENTEEAKKALHDYLRAKTQSILIGESDDADADDEDGEDEDEKSDEDDKDSDDKKSDDKAPPFAKKDKKDDKKEDDK
jgi:Ran GTPase-activating protein (RanGAP) involved in mRNA processing and transport